MSKQKVDKTVYTEVTLSQETGEVMNAKTVYRTQSEPDFVKLYIDCLFTVKGVKKSFNPIFLAFLEYMTYADANEETGGQTIYVNKAMKNKIAKKVGLSVVSVNNAITDFVKNGIFKRIEVGTYQVNPNIVGRGEWKDINNIRATFDFKTKNVIAEIVKDEEKDMTKNQQKLEEKFEEKIKRSEKT